MNFLSFFALNRFCFVFLLTLYPACTSCECDDHHLTDDVQVRVMTHDEERDLELFNSADHSRPGIFCTAFDTTATSFGSKRLLNHLRNPITDTAILTSRQQQLMLFIDNPQLCGHIEAILASIAEHEENLIAFMHAEQNAIFENTLENYYFQSNWCGDLNNFPLALDGRNYIKYLGLCGPVLEHLILHFALEHIQDTLSSPKKSHKHKHHKHDHTCIHDIAAPRDASYALRALISAGKIGHFAIHALSVKEMIDQMSVEKSTINELHKKVVSARECLLGIQQICLLLEEHGYSPGAFGLSDSLLTVFEGQEASGLRTLIDDESFSGNSELGFFSPIGQTLFYYRLLHNEGGSLEPVINLVGDIDALISMARWFNTVNEHEVRACPVHYKERSEGPFLCFKESWNLALNHTQVVPNTIELSYENGRHMIITGPNKAGKSSVLKSIGLNIVLAQTFGIAAAGEAVMTPFDKLLTHITVVDNISGDMSMMVAQMMRADRCIQVLQDLSDMQYACVLVDDSLFKGTSVQVGDELAYQFIKRIGNYAHCCSAVATHMPILTSLEEQSKGIFKNYCIDLSVDDRGACRSTFLLKEGIADSNCVFDILRSENYRIG